MNREEAIRQILKACRELGWIVATETGASTDRLRGLLIGERAYLEATETLLEGSKS